jgi:hypothetical protein
MTTCAILADSYFERQRKYGTALVKTPGRVIAFAINNHPRWDPLRSATTNRDLAGRGAGKMAAATMKKRFHFDPECADAPPSSCRQSYGIKRSILLSIEAKSARNSHSCVFARRNARLVNHANTK